MTLPIPVQHYHFYPILNLWHSPFNIWLRLDQLLKFMQTATCFHIIQSLSMDLDSYQAERSKTVFVTVLPLYCTYIHRVSLDLDFF
jgi:hypothetical protein